MFFCKFWEIFKNIFFTEHLWATASVQFFEFLPNLWNDIVSPMRYRSSRPDVLFKKDVLENFAKFIGKQLCQSLFFNKVAGLGLQLY